MPPSCTSPGASCDTSGRDDISEVIAARNYLGFSVVELRAIWITMGEVICNELLRGKAVEVSPFGTFTFSEDKIDMGTQGVKVVRKPCFVMAPSFAKKHSILPVNKRPADGIKAHPLCHGQVAILSPEKIDRHRTKAKLNRNTVLLVLNQFFNVIGDRCKTGDHIEVQFGPLGTFLFGVNKTRSSYFLFSDELVRGDFMRSTDIKMEKRERDAVQTGKPIELNDPEVGVMGEEYEAERKQQQQQQQQQPAANTGGAEGVTNEATKGGCSEGRSRDRSPIPQEQSTQPTMPTEDTAPRGGLYSPEQYVDTMERSREDLANNMTYGPSQIRDVYSRARRKDIPDDGTPNRVRTAAGDKFDTLYRQYFDEEMRNIRSSDNTLRCSKGLRSPLLLTSKGKTFLGRGRLPIGALAMTDGIRECPYCYTNPDGANCATRNYLPPGVGRSKSSTSIRNRFGFATSDPDVLEYAEYLRSQADELKREDDERRRERAKVAGEQARYNLSIADRVFNQRRQDKTRGVLNPSLEPMSDVFAESEAAKEADGAHNTAGYHSALLAQIADNATHKGFERTQTLDNERHEMNQLLGTLREDQEKQAAKAEATKRALSDVYAADIEAKRQDELELRRTGRFSSIYADKEGRGPLKWRTAPESREFHKRQMESLRKVMDEETRRFVKRKQQEEKEKQLEKMHKTDVLGEIRREEEGTKRAEQMIKTKYARELEGQLLEQRSCACDRNHGSCYMPIAAEDQLADLADAGEVERIKCDECGHAHYEVVEHN